MAVDAAHTGDAIAREKGMGPPRRTLRTRLLMPPSRLPRDMPLDACASGSTVLATRIATGADAMRRAAKYPPATIANLRGGVIALGQEGCLTRLYETRISDESRHHACEEEICNDGAFL